jgi:hypothetical protein
LSRRGLLRFLATLRVTHMTRRSTFGCKWSD